MSEITYYPLFNDVLPPLTPDERAVLKENLARDGQLHPIVTLTSIPGAIVDGWTRFELCHELGIEPRFESRPLTVGAARVWTIQQHIGRRNLNPFQRAALALKLKPQIAQEARQHMSTGVPEGGAPLRTDEVLAAMAETSKNTIQKTAVILESAPPYVQAACQTQDMSINQGYKIARALENAGEVTRNCAGKYAIDDPNLIELIKIGEASGAEWPGELLLSGCISVAESDETVSINEGAVALTQVINKRAQEHKRQAAQARYADILIDRAHKTFFLNGSGLLTIQLSEEELRKFEHAPIDRVEFSAAVLA